MVKKKENDRPIELTKFIFVDGEDEPNIVKVKHVTEHTLEIFFDNGHVSIVDFYQFIFNNPVYVAYRDLEYFLGYKLENGNINWHDFDMIFHIKSLYNNSICK